MIPASQIALAACLALLSLLCGGRNRAVASNAATTAVQAFLAAQNLDPHPDTMQFLLQPPDDTRIIAWSTSAAAECAGRGTPALLFPAQPTREHTAALVHAYFDAYNDRDGPRVLQLLSPAATLDDCGAHGPAGFQGKARIAAHLRYRFENDDHLTINWITFGDPDSARVAAVQVTRSSHWVEPIGLGLKMATTSDGRHLQSVVILTC